MKAGAHEAGRMMLAGRGALLDRESQMPLPVSIGQGPSGRTHEAGMKLVGGGALLDRESQMPLPASIDQGPSVWGTWSCTGRMELGNEAGRGRSFAR
jgi:hypothetical protein